MIVKTGRFCTWVYENEQRKKINGKPDQVFAEV